MTLKTLQLYEMYRSLIPWKICSIVLARICLHMNRKTYVASNVNCHVKNEEILKMTGSYVHRKSDNILETVQERDVATTDH